MSAFTSLRALAVSGLIGSLVFAAAQAASPTTPEQRAEMIQLVEKLETTPYTADGQDVRAKVLTWLIDAPDVSVTVCTYLLGDPDAFDGDDGGILSTQLMFSEARFILEHADQATNDHAVHVAGVEGVLRTYASMQSSKRTLKLAPMDKLVKIKADGKLDDYVKKTMERCN